MIDGASEPKSPSSNDKFHPAKPELTAGTGIGGRRSGEVRQALYLDMTDLLEYAKHNGTLSGIQRVVSSILTYAEAWANGHTGYSIVPIVPEYDRYRVLAVDFSRVVAMIDLIEEHQGGRNKIDAAIEAVYASRIEIYPRKGDMIVIAGAFWIYPHYDLLMRLRGKGVMFGLFVHDLIQIKNPEYVHKEATVVFRRSLIDALGIADFVLTNSHFVASAVEEFLNERLDFKLPIVAVPLATELRLKTADPGAQFPDQIKDILASDYVLCVGTIEVRKNHLLLIKIWEQLSNEIGDALPDLVFVGKWGWDIGPLRERLDETNFIQGRVRVVTNASDAALVELYRHCLMTAYVSFAEGFGLPVGESLVYGKPCVASRATSLPEVGGRFAKYIDTDDPDEGVQLFRGLLTSREVIKEWSADIRANYVPKTWRDFTNEFFDACCRLASSVGAARPANNVLLPVGAVYPLGDDAVQRADDEGRSLSSVRMARDSNWHPIESWGCWSSERDAALQFRVDLPEGAGFVVSLLLHAPPGTERASVAISINGQPPKRFALFQSASWCLLTGAQVAENGRVRIAFKCEGDFGRPDTRHLYLGLQALEIIGEDARALRRIRRRSWLTRGKAAARWATARSPGRALLSSRREDVDLRQTIHDAIEEKWGEARRLEAPPSSMLQVITPFGRTRAELSLAIPAPGVLTTPPGLYMTSANCLARDFYSVEFADFCKRVSRPIELHRRVWEYAFVAHHLRAHGALAAGKSGLGLTWDDDPLSALFAAQGCQISRQVGEASGSERHNFLWLIGSGFTLPQALDLIARRVVAGGVAILTGDLNLSAARREAGLPQNNAFTRADIQEITDALTAHGHRVEPLPFELGMTALDAFVDVPPFGSGIHLKTIHQDVLVTSFGMVVVRGSLT